jgi:hypothetical protein
MIRGRPALTVATLTGGVGLLVGVVLGGVWGPGWKAAPDDFRASSGDHPLLTGERGVSPPKDKAGPALAGDRADREELWAALQEEIEARERMEDEIAALGAELAELRRSASAADASETPETADRDPHMGRPWFNTEGLIAAGVDAARARQLRERFEEIELARLYLRDRAVREEWMGSPRYREESRALDSRFEAVREELGPEAFDQLLFAIGRPNRARVRDLLEHAPAREAGMEAADIIVSYDGTRIFSISELRRVTTEGRAGERVEVVVDRGGTPLRLYLPRGPLGARLVPARRAPLE